MPYRVNIQRGISYLFHSQNEDGGIALGNTSDSSSVWTSAETLDAILSSDYLSSDFSSLDNMIKIVDYIIKNFTIDPNNGNLGYWVHKRDNIPSTTATGHAIYALFTFEKKILSRCDIESIKIADNTFVIKDIKKDIADCVAKAQNWLEENQLIDEGWGKTQKARERNSSVICVYYVLHGLNAMGRDSSNNDKVRGACAFVKKRIDDILNNKRHNPDDISDVLYGYPCLVSSNHLTKSDDKFKRNVLKYINANWKIIKNFRYKNIQASEKDTIFVSNILYITLNALLTDGEYHFPNKIKELIKLFIENQENDGSWSILKGEKKVRTWVTAEALMVLNQAQKKFANYQAAIVLPKNMKILILLSISLAILNSILFITSLIHWNTFSNLTPYTIGNLIFSIFGFISSIITVIGFLKNGF